MFLVGLLLVGWLLFQAGMWNPTAILKWQKEQELSSELTRQLDRFLQAFHEREFEQCQSALDAINQATGRRALLLDEAVNRAINQFVTIAVACQKDLEKPEYRKHLDREYRAALAALRVAGGRSALSPDTTSWLPTAHHENRQLHPAELSMKEWTRRSKSTGT